MAKKKEKKVVLSTTDLENEYLRIKSLNETKPIKGVWDPKIIFP